MRILYSLLVLILFSSFSYKQKCHRKRVTVLKIDTLTSIRYGFVVFEDNKSVCKRILWNKIQNPSIKFDVGKKYKLKLIEKMGIMQIEPDGKDMEIKKGRASGYFINGIKIVDYEICND